MLALSAWLFFSSVLLWDMRADRPDDVARAFVEAVRKGDYASAASYWEPSGLRNVEANMGVSFRSFCNKYFRADRYTLDAPAKGKAGHYAVGFAGEYEGKRTSFMLYLKRYGGRWRLVQDRISPPR